MAFGPQFGLPLQSRPYHKQAGGPEDRYEGYAHRPFEKYIEVQVWSDEPVRSFLDSRHADYQRWMAMS